MKKKIIITTSIISSLVIIMITSFLISEKVIKPNKFKELCNSYDNQVVIYNGNNQSPINIDNKSLLEIDDNISISYIDKDNKTFKGLPKDVGKYQIKIQKEKLVNTIYFEIKPFQIKLDDININYQEGFSYKDIKDEIIITNNVPSVHNEKFDFEYEDCITDGINTYSFDSEELVIGNTYSLDVKMKYNSNYELYDINTNSYNNKIDDYVYSSILIKYQTVKIADKYYTIEDALKQSGEISLIGNNNTPVITSFTSLPFINKEHTLDELSTLYINHKEENIPYDNLYLFDKVYSLLYVPSDITLNVKGIVNVCASLENNSSKCYQRGVLFNNGTINVLGKYNSYGYTLGNGIINGLENSEISDVMCFYNYYGGGVTLTMSNAKIFPLTCYSIHNISCDVKIDKNGKLNAFYNIDLSGFAMDGVTTLVGENGLFELTDGYIIKKVKDTTSSYYNDKSNILTYTNSNQDCSQKDVIEIYGSFIDNVISIKQSNVGITTGLDYAMPIGFMDIIIKGNSTGILSSNSYKFLPGSSLIIEQDSKITIDETVNVVFYDENYNDSFNYSASNKISYLTIHKEFFESNIDNKGSLLVNNGELIVNGYLGGKITTTTKDSKIIVNNNYATMLKLISLTYNGSMSEKFALLAGKTTAVTESITCYLVDEDNEILGNGTYISDESLKYNITD